MPPRRSHKKSRAGCRRCKSRKIKCDELRPRCTNCDKHGVQCDFEFPELAADFTAQTPRSAAATPALTPATPAPTTPAPTTPALSTTSLTLGTSRLPPPRPSLSMPFPSQASRLLELRLLHHYATVTCKTLSTANPEAEEVWRDNVPRLAFASASNHLTDAVLAVAALHLRSLTPQDRELIRASHAYMDSSLREYNNLLQAGIKASNAEVLFLNSTLIAFQSTASRIFNKDEPTGGGASSDSTNAYDIDRRGFNSLPIPATKRSDNSLALSTNTGGYGLPMAWFHSFQGVKTITAASWPWLRRSTVALPIINAQPALHLNIASAHEGFFGHLLDDLDEELASISATIPPSAKNGTNSIPSGFVREHGVFGGMGTNDPGIQEQFDFLAFNNIVDITDGGDEVARTRHAYQHAVAVLNWAHSIPRSSACLAFPATVSRRFVELLHNRTPRAVTILACFFAMLKTLDSLWYLQGMARREVLGIVSMFNSDAVPVDVERRWWPHMQWAVRVALYHDDNSPADYVPPEVWGSSWMDEEQAVQSSRGSFVNHIDLISEALNGGGSDYNVA